MSEPEESPPGGSTQAPSVESLDETLVAYLDGQLAATESESVEARLAADAAARQRLQELDRVWNALDVLPRSGASESFTRTTVDMAAVSASAATKSAARRMRLRVPTVALTGCVGVALGAAIAFWLYSAPERRLLLDLPTAMAAPALEQAGSIEFLRLLADNEAVLEGFSHIEHRAAADTWAELSGAVLPERRQWVSEQDASALADVNDRVADFEARPDEKKQQLRDFAAEVQAAPDADALRRAALAYAATVERLTAAEQSTLRQLSPDERFKRVRRRASDWRERAVLELNVEERAALQEAVNGIVEGDDIRALIASNSRSNAMVTGKMRERPEMVVLMTAKLVGTGRSSEFAAMLRGRNAFTSRIPFGPGFADRALEAWKGWAERLTAATPMRVQELLSERRNEAARARDLEKLLRQLGSAELVDAFAQLPDDQMGDLLMLPDEQFREALEDGSELQSGLRDLFPPLWRPRGRPDDGPDARRGRQGSFFENDGPRPPPPGPQGRRPPGRPRN